MDAKEAILFLLGRNHGEATYYVALALNGLTDDLEIHHRALAKKYLEIVVLLAINPRDFVCHD